MSKNNKTVNVPGGPAYVFGKKNLAYQGKQKASSSEASTPPVSSDPSDLIKVKRRFFKQNTQRMTSLFKATNYAMSSNTMDLQEGHNINLVIALAEGNNKQFNKAYENYKKDMINEITNSPDYNYNETLTTFGAGTISKKDLVESLQNDIPVKGTKVPGNIKERLDDFYNIKRVADIIGYHAIYNGEMYILGVNVMSDDEENYKISLHNVIDRFSRMLNVGVENESISVEDYQDAIKINEKIREKVGPLKREEDNLSYFNDPSNFS